MLRTQLLFLFFTLFVTVTSLLSAGTWQRVSMGMPDSTAVLSLAFNKGLLYAGTDKMGVYVSKDIGKTWTAMPFDSKIMQSQTWALACADTFLFAGQRGSGVFRISPNAKVWTRVVNGMKNRVVQDLAVLNDTLYVATYGGFIAVSTDYGENWSVDKSFGTIDDSLCYSLAYNSTYIFAGTAGRNWSADTGVVFRARRGKIEAPEKINNGLEKNGVHWEGSFCMDANDTFAFVGTDDVGIFRTTDNGNQWQNVSKLGGDVHAVKIAENGYVYYGTSYGGIYSSSDNGSTWNVDNEGLSFAGKSLPYLVKDFILIDSFIYTATTCGVFRKVVPKGNTKEQKVKLLKPLNKTFLSATTDTLYWIVANNASHYRVQISERAEFFVKDVDTVVSNNHCLIPNDLNNNKEYFWRVKSTESETWSDVWSFTKQLSTIIRESAINTNGRIIVEYDSRKEELKISTVGKQLKKFSLMNLHGECLKSIDYNRAHTSNSDMQLLDIIAGVYIIVVCDSEGCYMQLLNK